LIESTYKDATNLGYTQAPIVVAFNPEFGFGNAPKVKKYTIAQYKNGYVDLNAVKEELNVAEREVLGEEINDNDFVSWGGSPTIIGSPQGFSSKLTMDEVSEIVKKHTIDRQ